MRYYLLSFACCVFLITTLLAFSSCTSNSSSAKEDISDDSLAYIVGEITGLEMYENYRAFERFKIKTFFDVLDTLKNHRNENGFLAGIYIADTNHEYEFEFYQKYEHLLPLTLMNEEASKIVNASKALEYNRDEFEERYKIYKDKMQEFKGGRERVLNDTIEICKSVAQFVAYNALLYLDSISPETIVGLNNGLDYYVSTFDEEDADLGYHQYIASKILVDLDMFASVLSGQNAFEPLYKGFKHVFFTGNVNDLYSKNRCIEKYAENKPQYNRPELIVP